MEYMPQVKVSKKDYLALSELAGDMSIMDYMSKVIHEHVAAQQSVQSDICPRCEGTGKYQRLWFAETDCALCKGTGKCR